MKNISIFLSLLFITTNYVSASDHNDWELFLHGENHEQGKMHADALLKILKKYSGLPYGKKLKKMGPGFGIAQKYFPIKCSDAQTLTYLRMHLLDVCSNMPAIHKAATGKELCQQGAEAFNRGIDLIAKDINSQTDFKKFKKECLYIIVHMAQLKKLTYCEGLISMHKRKKKTEKTTC